MKAIKLVLLILALTFAMSIHAANYYWTGGTGNWSDLNNWSTSSGGTGKHTQVPTPDDDVSNSETYLQLGAAIIGTNVHFMAIALMIH